MRFNLNASEVLALHNVLHERAMSHKSTVMSDDIALKQVYNRLRTMLIACLGNNKAAEDVNPLERWLKREQTKVDGLKADLDKVKKEQTSLPGEGLTPEREKIAADVDYDKDYFSYPHVSGQNRPSRRNRK